MMTRFASTTNLLLVGMIALSVLALTVGAARIVPSSRAVPPAMIAVIRLDAVIDGLDERRARQTLLDQMQSETAARIGQLAAELADKDDQYNILPDAEKPKAYKEIRKLKFRLDFERNFAKSELDEVLGEMFAELFNKIDDSVDQIAVQNGYTLVISDDSSAVVPTRGILSSDATRAITRRRVLYVAPEHDITADVIAYMNNAFAAGAP